MEILMILAIAAVVLAAAAAFEIYREVHSFTVTHYNVTSTAPERTPQRNEDPVPERSAQSCLWQAQ